MLKHHDQADGLRRMMTKPQARIISVISAEGDVAPGWLLNLAASMNAPQHRLLLIQSGSSGLPEEADSASLQAVAMQRTTLNRAIATHALGFDHARFAESNAISQPLSANLKSTLDGIVKKIASNYDTIMMEAQHLNNDGLTLPMMSRHELVVQMQRNEYGIKAAYSSIKRVCQQYGNRPFGLVVTGASAAQGQQYFLRLNQVCQQFLGVTVSFLGAIPEDDALQQSSVLGRSIMDAFPKAQAALAFKAVASSLGKQRLLSTALAAA